MKREFDTIVQKYISPVLAHYTGWVLSEAQRLGIKHLFFLARDGYQMYNIAKEISGNEGTPECSYFYCSRYALRMAAYRFHDDSAYDRLFIPAFKLTAGNMLKRAGFDEDERRAVYRNIGFPEDESTVMGRSEFAKYCDRVRNSEVFNTILNEKSDRAYEETVKYFRQEGMDRYDKIGIVDLGWTGSLQHTMKRILDSMGVKSEIHGFYMGMLSSPPVSENSEYHTWLFNEKNISVKAWFAHNLMECICTAPHGMTIGYKEADGKIVPVITENENNTDLVEKIKEITLSYAEKNKSEIFKITSHIKTKNLRRLHRLMFAPTEIQANALSEYCFCDDVGEQYHRSIVQNAKPVQFRKVLLFHKLRNRDNADGFYWYCGSVAASDLLIKTFYRYEYLITNLVILSLKKRIA